MIRRAGAAFLAVTAIASACTPATPPEERPVSGGTLAVLVRDLETLDPARASGRGALTAVAQIFDSLTAIDPETNAVKPAAAQAWQASRDGLRWQFTLAPAAFHDGRPVTAADFKRAFDRVARKSSKSIAAFQLEPVRGFRAVHLSGTSRSLSGVRARGPTTLEVRLDRPFAELPYVLAHPAFGPIPAKISDRRLAREPIGNGPYRVVEPLAGEVLTLERAADGAGHLDRVRFVLEPDTEAGWKTFRAGRAQVADVPPRLLARAREDYDPGGFTPGWATLSFGPNLRRKKYRSVQVRRAISMAIDRDAIATSIFGGLNDPATGILPRGIRGYLAGACEVCTLDRLGAIDIVAKEFKGKPPRVAVDHLNDESSRRVARAVVEGLREVGLRAYARAHTERAYRRLLQRGDHDLAELGWLSDVPTPDGFLARQLGRRSPDNNTGFRDRGFDAIVRKARATPDEPARLREYRSAETRALERMPLIPIVFFRNRTAAAPRVRGFVLDGAGLFDASRVWLAPSG